MLPEEENKSRIWPGCDVGGEPFLCGERGSSCCRLDSLRSRLQFDQAFSDRQNGRLGAVVDLQLMEDVAHVVLDGLFAQVEAVRDLFVRLPVGHQSQNGDLALGEVVLRTS